MSWSGDGTHWWDGAAWRPVGPDQRYYSDGARWIPLPQAAFPAPPMAAPQRQQPVPAGWAWNGQAWVPAFGGAARPARPRQPDVLAAAAVMIGVVLTVAGAFLPWAKAETIGLSLSKSGVDGGDGWITIGAAAVALLPALRLYLGLARTWARVGLLVLAAIIGAVAGIDWADVNNKLSGINSSGVATGKVGEGIYLTVVSAALLVIAAALSFRSGPAAPAPRAV